MANKDVKLEVSAIENGTVIDHIPSENLFKVIKVLGLAKSKCRVTIGFNLPSGSMGCKGVIKVSDIYFQDSALDRIALLATDATVNVIKDYIVVEKHKLQPPKEVIGLARCANPMCVTNHQPITTRFKTIQSTNGIKLHCHYCEKTTESLNLYTDNN